MGMIRLRSSFLISIILHVLMVVGWLLVSQWRAAQLLVQPKEKSLVWIELDKKLQSKENKQRIAETTLGKITQTPVENSFLGERSQIVDRQTVSKNHRTSSAQDSSKAQDQSSLAPQTSQSQANQPAGNLLQNLSRFGVPILPHQLPNSLSDKKPDPFQDRWASNSPLKGTLNEEASVPQEYIKGLTESDRTALNTREYVFYGYFRRIRQSLDLAWSRALRDQMLRFFKTGRNLASKTDHTTKILVTLNALGEVVRVQVVEESGVRDLDDAAIRAFNRAGPFPNPPKGILDSTGFVQIRWDFILKT